MARGSRSPPEFIEWTGFCRAEIFNRLPHLGDAVSRELVGETHPQFVVEEMRETPRPLDPDVREVECSAEAGLDAPFRRETSRLRGTNEDQVWKSEKKVSMRRLRLHLD